MRAFALPWGAQVGNLAVTMPQNANNDVASDPRITECLHLIRGFAETILDYVERITGRKLATAALTATDQIERVLRNRIEGMVNDHVSRAMDRIVASHPNGASVSYTLRYPQRSRHLLRLLTCAISDLVATRDDGLRHQHPKVLLDGLESWAAKVLGGAYYRDVNQEALEALGRVTTDENSENDRAIWHELTTDEGALDTYYRVAVPLLAHFSYDFEKTRVEMQRIISASTNAVVSLSAEQWSLLFHRLFTPLFRSLADHDEQLRIDALFEEGTALKLAKIYAEYKKWLKGNHISEPKDLALVRA